MGPFALGPFSVSELIGTIITKESYIGLTVPVRRNVFLPTEHFSKAFELFEKSAQRGYAESQLELGLFYELGVGTAKNHQIILLITRVTITRKG